ncbi:unnamed protein product [Dicrocoelium dendriticum]|nr:unnamed protein product [Dicrocoelium dendriticum]
MLLNRISSHVSAIFTVILSPALSGYTLCTYGDRVVHNGFIAGSVVEYTCPNSTFMLNSSAVNSPNTDTAVGFITTHV